MKQLTSLHAVDLDPDPTDWWPRVGVALTPSR